MNMRDQTVRAMVTKNTKLSAKRILDRLGLSMSDAINLMLVQIKLQESLPFEISMPHTPNQKTKEILDEIDRGEGLIKCKNSKELFNKLGI